MPLTAGRISRDQKPVPSQEERRIREEISGLLGVEKCLKSSVIAGRKIGLETPVEPALEPLPQLRLASRHERGLLDIGESLDPHLAESGLVEESRQPAGEERIVEVG